MRSAITLCLFVVGCFLTTEISLAQQLPENQAFNQHRFFSTPAKSRGYHRIFYQVCNLSNHRSAFRWQGAGFGVDAFAHLEPNICAFKNRYTSKNIADLPHTVSFQGGGSSPVMTWVPCYAILTLDESTCEDSLAKRIYAPYSVVEAMVTPPDGVIKLSEIQISVYINKDGSALITIEASDVFEKVVISLPKSSVSINDVRQIVNTVDTNVTVIIDRFDKVRTDPAPESKLLTNDIPEETASVAVEKKKEESLAFKLSISDLAKLGNLIVLFGEVGGQISIRNDIIAESPG